MKTQPSRDFISLPSPFPSIYHIFFLPGNPGLIEYYTRFLSLIHSTLNHASATTHFHVAGISYSGFEIEIESPESSSSRCTKPLNISEQVDYSLTQLSEYIKHSTTTAPETQTKLKPRVILIGHSFGTFVIAEMMKRIFTSTGHLTEQLKTFDVVGNIHLFPPIPDLARSPRGVKAAKIINWSYLPGILSRLAKAIASLPISFSRGIVRYLTNFSSDDAVETTRMFFGSRIGVVQALYLVQHEFEEIKLSRWEAAFRAIASRDQQLQLQSQPHQHAKEPDQESSSSGKKFPIRIFFGVNDHWVDNDLRDAFIYRYCDPNGPRAFGMDALDLKARIDPSADGDESNIVIPHDFSIAHSEHVVPHVAAYVEEIVKVDS